MVLSVLVALILTPALCSTLLKPVPKGSHGKTTGFFGWFNRTFDNGAERYERGLGRVIRSPKRAILLYGLRSEEHTSELQSLMRISYADFCLKKKNIQRYK